MGKNKEPDQVRVSASGVTSKPESANILSLGYPISHFRISMVTSPYGVRKHPTHRTMEFHTGIDIDTDMGESVLAAADGIIIFSGKRRGYGNVIIVEHSKELCTVYAHLAPIELKRGDEVFKGSVIGKVGVSGNSTGSHLHFEVRIDGKTVNPMDHFRIVN